ncbi:MAG TPA: type II toxin-antitoxin system HicB family antitoxin [Dehalococcoidia bacterium]
MAKEYSDTVILEEEADPEFRGYFNASVPALPCCFSYGATQKETLSNIREAILCYLEDLRVHGEPLPDDVIPWRNSKSQYLNPKQIPNPNSKIQNLLVLVS